MQTLSNYFFNSDIRGKMTGAAACHIISLPLPLKGSYAIVIAAVHNLLTEGEKHKEREEREERKTEREKTSLPIFP